MCAHLSVCLYVLSIHVCVCLRHELERLCLQHFDMQFIMWSL